MRLVPADQNEFNLKRRKYDNFNLLTEFAESELKCVEVVEFRHKNAHVCQTSLHSAIKHYRMDNIKVKMRGDRIFLVKSM